MKLFKILNLILINVCSSELVRRIVGGELTFSKPWMVYLYHPNSKCGGILYTRSTVITAAHCTLHNNNEWQAHLNRYDVGLTPIQERAQVFSVVMRINHPYYVNDLRDYDISVWWINSNSKARTLVDLDDGTQFRDRLSYVTVLGWGSTKSANPIEVSNNLPSHSLSRYLKGVNLPLVQDDLCQIRHGHHFNRNTMFCLGFERSSPSTCSGDSGGPAFRLINGRIKLMGVIDYTIGCNYEEPAIVNGKKRILNYFDVMSKISNPIIYNFIDHYAKHFGPENIISTWPLKTKPIPPFPISKPLSPVKTNNRQTQNHVPRF